jgi:predicted kinase
MQAILLVGLQGSGKSTFWAQRFRDTHVRLNLDMLNTRARFDVLLHACLAAKQRFVVDNTNVTPKQRRGIVASARAAGFEVVGYVFPPDLALCLARNAQRTGKARVPDVALHGTLAKYRAPTLDEGFDRLHIVHNGPDGFVVEDD